MSQTSQDKRDISSRPVLIVVMGVSGTGKSTLGTALAHTLGMPYVEGDDLHPASNIAKMSTGTPLTDADREPWLAVIRATAERVALGHKVDMAGISEPREENRDTKRGVVISSSALKKYYRDILRGTRKFDANGAEETRQSGELPAYFVYIQGSRDLLLERMEKRSGHFMKARMLESQLETLEDPTGEDGVVVVSMQDTTEEQVKRAVEGLSRLILNNYCNY